MEFYDEFTLNQKEEFLNITKKLEFDYNKDVIQYFTDDNKTKVKCILYFLADIVKQNKSIQQNSTMRATLIYGYDKCKKKADEYKDTPNEIVNFYEYYYKSLMIEIHKI